MSESASDFEVMDRCYSKSLLPKLAEQGEGQILFLASRFLVVQAAFAEVGSRR